MAGIPRLAIRTPAARQCRAMKRTKTPNRPRQSGRPAVPRTTWLALPGATWLAGAGLLLLCYGCLLADAQ